MPLVLTSFGVHTAPCSHGRCFTNALQRPPTPCLLPGAKYYHTSLPRLAKRQCWAFFHPAPDFVRSRRLQAICWQFWRLQGVTPPLSTQFRALLKWILSFAHSWQSFTTANLLHFAAKHGPLHHLPSRSFVAQQSLWSTVSSGSLDKMFRSSHDLAAATADFFTTTGLHAAAALAQSVCCIVKDLAALFRFSRSALPSTVHSTDEAAFSILSDSAEDDPIQSFAHHG